MPATSQAPSPVTAPGISTLAGVFSGVETAARNRLDHTIPNQAYHSRLPNLIAHRRATQPRATVSNPP
ncbi:MAG: hypothetical protein LBV21_00715, partial [Candidatus Adiutrix sp.]|nr:hypothetical protein [Candidatus Adiutrix sp.]